MHASWTPWTGFDALDRNAGWLRPNASSSGSGPRPPSRGGLHERRPVRAAGFSDEENVDIEANGRGSSGFAVAGDYVDRTHRQEPLVLGAELLVVLKDEVHELGAVDEPEVLPVP